MLVGSATAGGWPVVIGVACPMVGVVVVMIVMRSYVQLQAQDSGSFIKKAGIHFLATLRQKADLYQLAPF